MACVSQFLQGYKSPEALLRFLIRIFVKNVQPVDIEIAGSLYKKNLAIQGPDS